MEMMGICTYIPGAFMVRDLMEMDYGMYETIVKYIQERIKESKNG
jgi:hypothetical protein